LVGVRRNGKSATASGRVTLTRIEFFAALIGNKPRSAVHLFMENRRKLLHDLQRYRSLLPLTTDPQAITVLEELIRETRERLDDLDRDGEAAC
jgi:hypothetical protein